MAGSLTMQRVQGDVAVLARAGLDTASFIEECTISLQRAVPHVAACVATTDPATHLLTSTYKFGDLAGNDDHDHDWALIEYGGEEPTSFRNLVQRDEPVCAVAMEMGERRRSVRMRDLIDPCYGYIDELRMVGRHAGRGWGGMAIYRAPGEQPFSEAELTFMAGISSDFAAGLRSGLLARLAGSIPDGHHDGPAVIIVGADDKLSQVSVGAEAALRALGSDVNMASATGIVGGLVAAARRYAAGLDEVLPRARVRLPSGQWLVLHASPLASAIGSTGDVVITMEEARPPEIVPLVVAAFELTGRERDVTHLVLQGVDTKDIATRLHMSRYTVQDHLKSVFDKADVRSRRELISRVFFDQYSPRMNAELAPSGWFTPGT